MIEIRVTINAKAEEEEERVYIDKGGRDVNTQLDNNETYRQRESV